MEFCDMVMEKSWNFSRQFHGNLDLFHFQISVTGSKSKQTGRFVNWGTNEPRLRYKTPNCVLAHVGAHNVGKWANVECGLMAGYICESPSSEWIFDNLWHNNMYRVWNCLQRQCYRKLELSVWVHLFPHWLESGKSGKLWHALILLLWCRFMVNFEIQTH